ncbi:hypothetical protein D3C71_1841050 [compost metagenome]
MQLGETGADCRLDQVIHHHRAQLQGAGQTVGIVARQQHHIARGQRQRWLPGEFEKQFAVDHIVIGNDMRGHGTEQPTVLRLHLGGDAPRSGELGVEEGHRGKTDGGEHL